MKEIKAAAGERVRVIRRAFSSVPMDYRFEARAARPGQALAGTVEVRKSRWIIPGSIVALPLQASNLVQAGFWDTFVSVDVVPAVDAVITIEGKSIRHLTPILLASLAILIVAAAMLVMFRP
jgi:hypothetical protein